MSEAVIGPSAPAAEAPGLRRSIGPFQLFAYTLGGMLGAGIYGLVGRAAGQLGSAVWLGFIVAMVAALLTGLSYASLGSRYPRAGGAAYITHRTYHRPLLTWMVGLAVMMSGLTSVATQSRVVAENLLRLFDVPMVAPVLVSQARDHARRPVEIPAMRHAVEVRADHHARRFGVASRQGHVGVRREIPLDAQPEPLRRRHRRPVRPLLAGAVRVARHPRLVGAVAPQRVEQRLGQAALRRHRLVDIRCRYRRHAHSSSCAGPFAQGRCSTGAPRVKERRPRFHAPSVGAISRSASTAEGASTSTKSAGLPTAMP